jgi:hypothetical protein
LNGELETFYPGFSLASVLHELMTSRFMQADPWWSFAMAFNVFVVFYCNVDPTCFRRYVWPYIIVCFGGPLIPAITLISIRDDERGPVYGDAAVSGGYGGTTLLQRTADWFQLWCWIGPKWSLVRLYAYYIPIWVCIFLSILIYIAVGYQVFHHRNRLRSVAFQSIDKDGRVTFGPSSDSGESAVEVRNFYANWTRNAKILTSS